MIAIGLPAATVLNALISTFPHEHRVAMVAVTCFVYGLIMLGMIGAWLATLFLPTIIARRENRTKKMAITIGNFFFLVPGVWIGIYVWSCLPKSKQSESLINSTPTT